MTHTTQSHVIQKGRLNIKVRNQARAYEIQSQVIAAFQQEVLPLLERELDHWVPADRVVYLDRLELDLGRVPLDRLHEALPRLVADKLHELLPRLVESADTANGQQQDRHAQALSDSMLDALIRFLRTGRVGWQAGDIGTAPARWMEALLRDASAALGRALTGILGEPVVAERLSLQFVHQVEAILGTLLEGSGPASQVVRQLRMAEEALDRMARHLAFLPQNAARQKSLLYSWAYENWQELRGSIHPLELVTAAIRAQVKRGRLDPRQLASSLSQATDSGLLAILSEFAPALANALEGHLGAAPQAIHDTVADALRSVLYDALTVDESATITQADLLQTIAVEVAATKLRQPEEVTAWLVTSLRAAGLPEPQSIPGSRGRQTFASKTQRPTRMQAPEDPSHTQKRRPLPAPAERKSTQIDEDRDIYVQNAGLVLLNPFLQPCFEDLGWMKNGEFVSDEAQENAVLFTAYLASGESEIAEPQLPLAKLLCGMDLVEPVRMVLDLPERALEEADTLLTAANEHWKRAGKLSPAQFREAFLVREGRLEAQGAGWNLKVDRHTIDILLEFLPWSFGTIKLPWMNGLLSVDW